MADAAVVRNLMTAYGIGGAPGADATRTYLTDVLGINSAEEIRDLDRATMKVVRRQIQSASTDQAIPAADRPNAAVGTIRGLEVIIFAVQWQVRHDVAPDVDLMNALVPRGAVRYWKAAYRFKVDNERESTKEADIDLPVLPKGTMPNTSQFYEWWDSFVLKLDTFISSDGFTPLGYIVRQEDDPVDYDDIDWTNDDTMQDRTKANMILAGDDYRADRLKLYQAVHAALAETGQSWLTSHSRTKDVRAGLTDLQEYYYGTDNEEEKIKKIKRKIRGVHYNNERAGLSFEAATGKLRELFKQLADIGPQAELRPAEKVEHLLQAIKCKNGEMVVGKITVKNDRAGMAADYEQAVSFLKNCLPADNSRAISLSALETARADKQDTMIAAMQAEIAALSKHQNKKGRSRKSSGGGNQERGDWSVQSPIVEKWKEGTKLSDSDKLELCKGFSNEHYKTLPKDLKGEIRTWRDEQKDGTLKGPKGRDNAYKKIRKDHAKLKRKIAKLQAASKSRDDSHDDDDNGGTSDDSVGSDPSALIKRSKWRRKK